MLNKHQLKQGEMLCTTTIRIEARDEKGQSFTGTGFFYSMNDEDDTYIPVIITNRHVVEEMRHITLVITQADKQGNRLDKYCKFEIDHFLDGVIFHPDNNVDLCAITLLPIIAELQKEGMEIYSYYINKKVIPSDKILDELDAIEDILMIGYPNGLWDEKNNLPLVRRGITSTHPNLDYNGDKEFLIDAPCFHGSSGSPIFYLDKSYKKTIVTGELGYQAYLLGILYSGPVTEIEGNLADATDVKVYTQTMLNLGYVIKAERLYELEEEVEKVFNKLTK